MKKGKLSRPVVNDCGVRLDPDPASRPMNQRKRVSFQLKKTKIKKNGDHQDEQCRKPGHPPIVSCAGLPLV